MNGSEDRLAAISAAFDEVAPEDDGGADDAPIADAPDPVEHTEAPEPTPAPEFKAQPGETDGRAR